LGSGERERWQLVHRNRPLDSVTTMNNQYRRAGKSTREMADRRYKTRVWFVLLTIGMVLLLLFLVFQSRALGIGGLGVLGLIILVRLITDYTDSRVTRMMKEERRAIRGAKAEERIGSILESLGEDYLIVDDVESPFGNIDHVVISKQSGVFLIETKSHGGKVSITNGRVLVNGHEPEKDFIAQTLRNTYWLRDKLRQEVGVAAWITPILAFTNAFVEPTPPVKGIVIVNKKYLVNALQKPGRKGQSATIWASREKVRETLCHPN
jgi:hypothetical protein